MVFLTFFALFSPSLSISFINSDAASFSWLSINSFLPASFFICAYLCSSSKRRWKQVFAWGALHSGSPTLQLSSSVLLGAAALFVSQAKPPTLTHTHAQMEAQARLQFTFKSRFALFQLTTTNWLTGRPASSLSVALSAASLGQTVIARGWLAGWLSRRSFNMAACTALLHLASIRLHLGWCSLALPLATAGAGASSLSLPLLRPSMLTGKIVCRGKQFGFTWTFFHRFSSLPLPLPHCAVAACCCCCCFFYLIFFCAALLPSFCFCCSPALLINTHFVAFVLSAFVA